MLIHFNRPPVTGNENNFITEALGNNKISGDGPFTKKCDEWIEEIHS